jgi:hypothetical protein
MCEKVTLLISILDKGYSGNATCTLTLISTFLLPTIDLKEKSIYLCNYNKSRKYKLGLKM